MSHGMVVWYESEWIEYGMHHDFILMLCNMEMTKHAEKLLLGLFVVRDRKERPRCEKTFRDQKFIPAC